MTRTIATPRYCAGALWLLPAMLGGCASFSGVPKTVIPLRSIVDLASDGKYGLAMAADRIEASSDVSKSYRDAFIAVQMAAIDARYLQFRSKLSAQSKGANFGLELGVLALTGAGSVVTTSLANVLSAGGAGLTGTKAALSKEVYFERTLPAILASMDAQRIAARTPIMAGLGRDTKAYPLAQAVVDLFAYQNSASIDSAIGQLTASATKEQAKAEAKYENVTPACSRPEQGVGRDWDTFAAAIDRLQPALAADAKTLQDISTLIGSDPALPVADQANAISDRVEAIYCTRSAMTALMTRISSETKVAF
ncbi:hypothetical protein [Sphingomonas sp. Leaf37]|uniref:hypothetical protein n=1 Tax=Sphingomonas sp. Leaf37 TaxID=2876552 RepID=UPI001E333818|nr:hypothetical protein [Sphingomonas sp. Leaf37]